MPMPTLPSLLKVEAPTLINLLKQGAEAVTGEDLMGARYASAGGNGGNSGNRFGTARNAPRSRTARGSGDVSRNWNRVAQMGGNTTYTSPSFYTPFTTPSSFQIPSNRKEIYLWAKFWNDNEPKVAAGIEFYTDFPLSGFTIECSNTYVKDYFDELCKRLNFYKYLPLISQEYHLRGDVFILSNLDCDKCLGTNEDEDGEVCEHHGATWKSLNILNPDTIEIIPGFMNEDPMICYIPTDAERSIVETRQPYEQFKRLPKKLVQSILRGMPIKLEPEAIWHLKRGAAPWEPYGSSMLRRLFPSLAYKDKLRQAQWIIAERHIVPIKICKVGNDAHPANEEDIEGVQEELARVSQDPILTLVTPHAFELDYVGASGKILQVTTELEAVEQDIVDGLMLNKSIINGDGPSYSNAQVGLITMAKRLDRFRQEVAYWMEERIFKPVSIWNGFSIEGKRGQEEFIYPTIKWDDLQLRDDTGKLQMLVTAQQNGVISAQTLIEAFGLDYDQEVERLRYEQSANMVADMASMGGAGGIGSGYGGAMGMSGGAGGAPPMGGGGEDAGGAPPAGGPEGAPGGASMPGSAGMAPAPPMGGMASVGDALYKKVVGATNAIAKRFQARTAERIAMRLAEKEKILSAAHEGFLRSIRIADGRGYGDLLDDDCELVSQFDTEEIPQGGGLLTLPLNRLAMKETFGGAIASNFEVAGATSIAAKRFASARQREVMGAKKADRPMPHLFTRLEQKLYDLVLACNLPFPFYAQYQAGPNFDYQLDGAFPSVKLGVEADSETFHSAPEKVAKDRSRDQELAMQGWHVLRFTEAQLIEQPDACANVILATVRHLAGGGSGAGGQQTVTL